MCFKRISFFLLLCFITASCVKPEEHTYTYVIEGKVHNLVTQPLQGIQVIMQRSYSTFIEADTAFTDAQGLYTASLKLKTMQRAFVVSYKDFSKKYRDTVLRFTYENDDDPSIRDHVYYLKDTLVMKAAKQIDPDLP